MSEFKGTKGKWVLDCYGNKGGVIDIVVDINEHESGQIAQAYSLQETSYNAEQNQEHKANALLISKAPEMLEMLKTISDSIKQFEQPLYFEIEKLIKEATEL